MLLDTIPVEKINDAYFSEKGIDVSVLRLDKIHPVTGGNKWFKLKYNLEEFSKQKKDILVTVGGAYSNHIIATAAAGKEYGIQTVGIIRGEELNENSNDALKFASSCGMKLFFVTREEYRLIRQTEILPDQILSSPCRTFGLQGRLLSPLPAELLVYRAGSSLLSPLSSLFFLPEGGSNALAVKGCSEIINLIPEDFDFIVCAVGTGATLAGISTALKSHQTAIGISVLEGKDFLEKNILEMNGSRKNFQLFHDYNFGGYARSSEELDNFCKNFSQQHNIPIEPIYTGKMFFGLWDLIKKNFFKSGSRIVAIHTGGVRN